MTHILIPISKSHKSETTSNVYSVLNKTKCLSCHSVWSFPHTGDEEPGGFLRTPAISAAKRQETCADFAYVTWRNAVVVALPRDVANSLLPNVNLLDVFFMTGKNDWYLS